MGGVGLEKRCESVFMLIEGRTEKEREPPAAMNGQKKEAHASYKRHGDTCDGASGFPWRGCCRSKINDWGKQLSAGDHHK